MLTLRLLLFILGLISPRLVSAEESAAAPRLAGKLVSSVDIFQWMFALLLVLAVFGGLVWFLRKSGSLSLMNKSQLAIVAGLSLGMREKLVLVKVGEKQLLLGVTSGRIDKLLELEGDQRLFQNRISQNDPGSFEKKLKQLMQGKSDE